MRKRKGPSSGRNQRPARSLPARVASSRSPRLKTPPQTPYERELTTKRRGEISELAFALAAARHGFGISRPYGDSERYDIILDCREKDPSHLRSVISTEAQHNRGRHPVIPTEAEQQRVKWSACPEPVEGALHFACARPRLIRVQVKATTQLQYGLYRANAHRRIYGKAVPYTLDEIDFFAAYVIPKIHGSSSPSRTFSVPPP